MIIRSRIVTKVIFIVALMIITLVSATRAQEDEIRGGERAGAQVPRRPYILSSDQQYSVLTYSIDSTDVYISDDSATDQSENSVFIHPKYPDTVLNSNNTVRNLNTAGFQGLGRFRSITRGKTWVGASRAFGSNGTTSIMSDPAVGVSRNGTMYVGCIDSLNGQSVYVSTNGGSAWTRREVRAVGDAELLDKNHLWIDNHPASPYVGNVYVTWTRVGTIGDTARYRLYLSRSTNNGTSWSTPIQLSDPSLHEISTGSNIQTGPNGEVYVVWAALPNINDVERVLRIRSSTDGGITWGSSNVVVDSISGLFANGLPLSHPRRMRVNSFPSMTVNQQTGKLYVAWTNVGRFGGTGNTWDIYLTTSIDSGVNWSTPHIVNQDTVRDQFYPWIACDEVSGALAMIFYSSKDFTGNDSLHTYIGLSYDDGATWAESRISDVPWDGGRGTSMTYQGDYIGIDISYCAAVPVWTGKRIGVLSAYSAPFTVPGPSVLNVCTVSVQGLIGDRYHAIYGARDTVNISASGCSVELQQYSDVVVRAGSSVVLKPGFVAYTGSNVRAYIAASDSMCWFGEMSVLNRIKDTENRFPAPQPQEGRGSDVGQVRVFPNPSESNVTVCFQLDQEWTVHLDLFASDGTTVSDGSYSGDFGSGYHCIPISVSDLPSGIYFVRVSHSGISNFVKLQVVR